MKIIAILMPRTGRISPPMELALTTALLRRDGHECVALDLNNAFFHADFRKRKYWQFARVNDSPDEAAKFHDATAEHFERYAADIVSRHADLIIFKNVGQNSQHTLHMVERIRDMQPGLPVIISGRKNPDGRYREYLRRLEKDLPCHYFINGDYEAVLPTLVRAIESGKESTSISRLRISERVFDTFENPVSWELDPLPFYDYSDYDISSYGDPGSIELQFTRGCTWTCSFCHEWRDESFRSMSARRLFDEVCHQVERHPSLRRLSFIDKSLNANVKVLQEFCDLMVERNPRPDIRWGGDAMIRPQMTSALLAKLREAGCERLGYGVESGSQTVLDHMGKRFQLTTAEEVLKNTHRAGITTIMNLIIGYPTESSSDFEESLAFVRRVCSFVHQIRLAYPGCEVSPSFPLSKLVVAGRGHSYLNWTSVGGGNTLDERIRRFRKVVDVVLSHGLELRMHARPIRTQEHVDEVLEEMGWALTPKANAWDGFQGR